jgi:hypothetical protein
MEASSLSTTNKRFILVHRFWMLHSSCFSIAAVATCKSFLFCFVLFCLFILSDMGTRLRGSLANLNSESGGRVYRWPWETAGRLVIFICCLLLRSCSSRAPVIVVVAVYFLSCFSFLVCSVFVWRDTSLLVAPWCKSLDNEKLYSSDMLGLRTVCGRDSWYPREISVTMVTLIFHLFI